MTATLTGRRALVTGGSRGIGAEITVNSIQPGPIATDMNPEQGEFADAAKQSIALGHYGNTRDIASAVSCLAGRSGCRTGQLERRRRIHRLTTG